MAHIHISLIGGQSYPVYLGIADLNPDGIILIHSSQSREEAERIQQEIDVPTHLLEFDPVDIQSIYHQLEKNFTRLASDDIYTVNITGGTKLWSIAFYEYFKRYSNAKLIYIDQNNCVCNLVTLEKYQSVVSFDTDSVLRLNGTKAESYLLYQDYTEADKNCINRIKKLRRHSYEKFNAFSIPNKKWENELKQKKLGSWRLEDGSQIEWDKETTTIKILLINNKSEKLNDMLTSPHIFNLFFHTGWFEYEVASLLSTWQYAKEIRMNVKFPYNAERNPKNEIDLIVNTGNRLLFVECKTQISDITDIDKFRTAVKNYGGMACKALFVTDAPMKKTAAEKCEDSGILSFSIRDCNQSFFSIQEMLHLKLEQELFAINKK